ncbi:MAG: uncharacterized protein PWP54_627 [Thermosipho sp. (in: thermotogales)]|nr:uncharacterized protein [Thermosipho sp. (in: thermotogales)]
MKIKISQPNDKELENLGVKNWPIWTKEVSEFDWFYDDQEICYFIEGEVEVETDNGEVYKIKKGDLVVFPRGLKCKWKVIKPVKKHYKFGE